MEINIVDRNEKLQLFNPNAITDRIKQIISGDFDNFKLKDLLLPYSIILKKNYITSG